MLPKELKWYFPESIEEAGKLIKQPGVFLHAGGTRILKTQPKAIEGLVDISGLGLNYIHLQNGIFSIGSATTFGEIVHYGHRHKNFPCWPNRSLLQQQLRCATGLQSADH